MLAILDTFIVIFQYLKYRVDLICVYKYTKIDGQ